MRNKEIFKDKSVVVVGLARSGIACANLLYSLGAKVSVTESRDSEATREAAQELRSRGITVELGKHSKEFFKSRDFIIVSPGVPANSQPIIWAKEYAIPVLSEIEAAWLLCPATVIAVTGSGGKTTVTTLIGKAIQASGKKVFVCGNIGNPFSGEVEKIAPEDFVSLEVSSFQLENIAQFKPHIAVVLNFNRNHLDRHKDMQEYLDAKKRIFANQDAGDYLVLNDKDRVLKGLAEEARSKVVFFGSRPSEYNPNQQAVMAVASILGIDKEVCVKVFSEFKGLEHRMEFVAEVNGVRFINDSKATLAESTVWAINNISSPVILIAGGKDKGVDYSLISKPGAGKIKEIITIGEAADLINDALGKSFKIERAKTLEEAINLAFDKARPGDSVLLSPMCSSFDMFANFEERGRVFKQAVMALALNSQPLPRNP
ncbi:MAG: Mur ligase family protein [Candidatus Omnitrophota bacterium]